MFDSIYQNAFRAVGSDNTSAMKGLQLLLPDSMDHSPAQTARIKYLRYSISHAYEQGLSAVEERKFPAHGFHEYIDSLIFLSRQYLDRSMPDKAIPLLLEAISSLSSKSEKSGLHTILLSEAYRQKQEYTKGIALLNGLFTGNEPLPDEERAYAYNRMAALYNEWGQPPGSSRDSVFHYSEMCLALSERIGSIPNMAASQNELSFLFIRKKEYDKALKLSLESILNFEAAGMPFHAMNAMINLSQIYRAEKKFALALKTVDRAIGMSEIKQNPNLYLRLYCEMAEIYKSLGDMKEAYEMLRISYRLQGGFFRDRIDMQINEQSAKYDLLVKEQKIKEEKQINAFQHKQLILLIILLFSFFLAFVAALLYFRLRKRGSIRQKLMEAVVETETRERKRIARDLHDGLGPELSAINHYFQAFLDARPEDKEPIRDRLQQVISGSIEEVSRISHNISPHVLEKHGLEMAVSNYFSSFSGNSGIQINFRADLPERFDLTKELTLYRCITELFHNTLKHAGATHVLLKIWAGRNMIRMFYSDNGKGFLTGINPVTGMGLHNIRHRIESFGGKFDLESAPGKGIKATIELPI